MSILALPYYKQSKKLRSRKLRDYEIPLSIEMQNYILEYLRIEFGEKHLSKRFLDYVNSYEIFDPSAMILSPPAYDTAWYIKSSRSGRGKLFRNKDYSYALNLDKKGSEFEVFKKRRNAPNKPISKLGEKWLYRVKVYPHNHKNFVRKAVIYAVLKFVEKHRSEIEGVELCITP